MGEQDSTEAANTDAAKANAKTAQPSDTAPPEDARAIDKNNPNSSTARPAGHAVNGDTSTTGATDPKSLGTGTMLKNK